MSRLRICTVPLALGVALTGCSQETQRKAGEALDQTGEAIEGAAEDAANLTKGAVEGASKAAEENRAEPDTKSSR